MESEVYVLMLCIEHQENIVQDVALTAEAAERWEAEDPKVPGESRYIESHVPIDAPDEGDDQ